MNLIKLFLISLLVCSFLPGVSFAEPATENTVCASCPAGKCAFIFNFSNLRTNETVQVMAGETKALQVKPCDPLAITVVLGKQIPSFVVAPCHVSVSRGVEVGDKIVMEGAVTDPVATIKSKDCNIQQGK